MKTGTGASKFGTCTGGGGLKRVLARITWTPAPVEIGTGERKIGTGGSAGVAFLQVSKHVFGLVFPIAGILLPG